MLPLDKSLRNRLERTIKEARDTAENAAKASLEQLGVGEAVPFAHLLEDERELRRRLRLHGRQLGDSLNGGKVQTMDRLIEEVAYEHWHRMLFARFLAENNLLMFDGVAVTLEECAELAADDGLRNEWELAARLATAMLPQIFRPDSVVFALHFPPEHQQRLERLVSELPPEVFTASDSLGWVYQFWQAKKKEAVNASEVKIGARELPAVTQLFTEPYMVAFLLDNALGAWWAARRLTEKDYEEATTEFTETTEIEKELRRRASIPGVSLEYLRFVKEEPQIDTDSHRSKEEKICVNLCSSVVQKWVPAAGTFDGWPEQLADLKTLDPCCGSGHFLVAVFLMLVPMRMELEGLSARQAVDAVLRDNLHGLELDQRCVELAAFALAVTAWRYPNLPSPSGRGAGGEGPIGYRPLPELHLACSGLSVSVAKEEWKALALGKQNLALALAWMHDTFRDAPVLGSLLDPKKSPMPLGQSWAEIAPLLTQALSREQAEEQQEAAVVAQGLTKAATLLAARYAWVITNVPYLARGKQDERLRDFCEKHYAAAKNDLATVFLDRCLELAFPPSPSRRSAGSDGSLLPSPSGRGVGGEGKSGGTVSVVLPQNWLFLTSYKKFREKLLKNETWHMIARLGPGAFETISGEVVKAILITLSRGNALTPAFILPCGGLSQGERGQQSLLPPGEGARRADEGFIRGLDVSEPRTASDKAAGLITAEIKQVKQAKQLENPDARVALEDISLQKSLGDYCSSIEGLTTGDMERFVGNFWEGSFSDGWVPYIQSVDKTTHHGGLTDRIFWEDGAGTLSAFPTAHNFPSKIMNGKQILGKPGLRITQMRHLPITMYSGDVFGKNGATVVPDDPAHLPAIWCFCSSPAYNEAVRQIDQSLKVTNATLVKVPFDLDHWTKVAQEKYPNGLPKPYSDDPTQWLFHGHPASALTPGPSPGERGGIDVALQVAVARLLGYRWPAELDSAMELSAEARAWTKKSEELLSHADEDGIVCIPAVRGEMGASDRLENLLAAAYGNEWSSSKKSELLAQADHAGKTMDTWLREKFFAQHCKLFQHRPFIWHIWDGLRDGFAALVNYHKLDYKNLETLIYTYLGDWISRQKQDITGGVDGAAEKLAAAEQLKKKLELILEGEAPYDIFVRWKPIDQQPIGWNPDPNDGVRLNIRPFLTVPDVAKKGAGVLRDKPNIKWEKDRGKDVESAPWYHLWGGDRINDHHLTLAAKRSSLENNDIAACSLPSVDKKGAAS